VNEEFKSGFPRKEFKLSRKSYTASAQWCRPSGLTATLKRAVTLSWWAV
jgi:hypothetical protein